MNKYQGAVNQLSYILADEDDIKWTVEEKREILNTLQELIDKYIEIENTVNYLVNVRLNDAIQCGNKLLEAIGEDND